MPFILFRDTINNIREEYLTMLWCYVRQKEEDADDIINRVMVVTYSKTTSAF